MLLKRGQDLFAFFRNLEIFPDGLESPILNEHANRPLKAANTAGTETFTRLIPWIECFLQQFLRIERADTLVSFDGVHKFFALSRHLKFNVVARDA
jgi:hypothetical protein